MNHMNMNGMNGVNGAVGGMPMINHATNGTGSRNSTDQDRENDYEVKMNTYIYDYFLKNKEYGCARSLLNSRLKITTRKSSPSHGDVNGIDDSSMDADSKDNLDSNRPDGLPQPHIPGLTQNTSFLLEWFSVFWDMYFAQRKDAKATTQAMQYVQHTQHQSRLRQEQQHRFLQQPGMINGGMGMQSYQNLLRIQQQQANGVPINPNDLRLRASQNNNRNVTPQQISQMQGMQQANQQRMLQQQQQQQQQQAMQRDGSDGDMNGQRPRTPSSGENAPSPSKRQRLDGPPFPMGNGQLMPNGRQPQGMQGPQMMGPGAAQANQANNLLIQAGINPGYLSQTQLDSFHAQNPHVQKKSIQVYAQNMAQQHRNNMPQQGMPNQGSPMMPSGLEVGAGMADLYGTQAAQMRMGQMQQNGATGNHALQDYQMQLMLLEQQNKKRLLLAKQEQEAVRPDGQPMAGQPGFPPGMSPSGSRSGPSPNPQDQMKRGSPKMGQGLTGSPMPDGSMPQARGSPAAMNFGGMSGGIPPEMFQSIKGMGDGMGAIGPNGQIMRPPSSHPPQFNSGFNPQPMEHLRQQQNSGRMQPTNWQQGPQGQAPMVPQPSQVQQPAQMGTPIQRNTAMPPPQAPPTGNATNGRPASPAAQVPAPPTPQASKAANPKKVKDKKDRKPPTKKNSVVAVTPSSEAENPPPTPTPSTPVTSTHPDSFNKSGKGGNGQNQGSNLQTTASAPAPVTAMQPPQDVNGIHAFGNMESLEPSIDMSFGGIEGDNVLDQFDFDSFLQEGDHALDFDASMAFTNFDAEVVGEN